MTHFIKDKLARAISLPWYPLIFSLNPILVLLLINVGQVKVNQALRPALASILFTLGLYALVLLFLRNLYRAAFLATFLLILFFSYGHFRIFLAANFPNNGLTDRLIFLWLVLAFFFGWCAVRPKNRFKDSVEMVNVLSLGLVLSLLVQILWENPRGNAYSLGAKNAPIQEQLVMPEKPQDVYYIILDSYGRKDLLLESYEFDNSLFATSLLERGFFIAECSQSNYARTELSLGSSLNMAYLQGLDPAFVPESRNRPVLWNALKHSAVRYNFEKLGYRTVAFATGFEWNEVEDADYFLVPHYTSSMTEFETLFLNTTLGFHAREWGLINTDEFFARNYRNRTLFVFEQIETIASNPEPTFSYIHIMSPHPPFVFGLDGEPTDPADFWDRRHEYTRESYARGYQNQLQFLNKKLISAIDTILSESDVPPIIVLQGDHGPWFQPDANRFKIFNAYYLSGDNAKLYSEISPVNTFRVIFDEYFGGKYGLLPDVSYLSPVPNLFEFSEISVPCVQ